LIHTGEKLEHEPFIFASQTNQVFYVNDHLNPGWCITIGVKPRDLYNLDDGEILKDAEFELYHVALVHDVAENTNHNPIQNWIRLEVEGVVIDDEKPPMIEVIIGIVVGVKIRTSNVHLNYNILYYIILLFVN
jgi:hypothetical protein